MITSLDTIKQTLNTNYFVYNLENNSNKILDHKILEYSENLLKKFSFINGLGWGETNLTQKCTYLYVVKGMNFAQKVAMSGKAGSCPIISYCATSKKQIKLYSDVVLNPVDSENSNYISILKIRNDEGVSHGLNVSKETIIQKQEIIPNIFISWGDKKVNELKFKNKNIAIIKEYIELVNDYLELKYNKGN